MLHTKTAFGSAPLAISDLIFSTLFVRAACRRASPSSSLPSAMDGRAMRALLKCCDFFGSMRFLVDGGGGRRAPQAVCVPAGHTHIREGFAKPRFQKFHLQNPGFRPCPLQNPGFRPCPLQNPGFRLARCKTPVSNVVCCKTPVSAHALCKTPVSRTFFETPVSSFIPDPVLEVCIKSPVVYCKTPVSAKIWSGPWLLQNPSFRSLICKTKFDQLSPAAPL